MFKENKSSIDLANEIFKYLSKEASEAQTVQEELTTTLDDLVLAAEILEAINKKQAAKAIYTFIEKLASQKK